MLLYRQISLILNYLSRIYLHFSRSVTGIASCGLFTLLALNSPLFASTATSVMDYQTARAVMQAIGKIQFQAHQLDNLLSYCGKEFSHLAESAGRAGRRWHKTNNPVIQHAVDTESLVLDSVKQSNSLFAAEKLALELDHLVSSKAKAFRQDFQNRTRKQQHYLCNRFILSVTAGERDLSNEIPEATHLIMEYK